MDSDIEIMVFIQQFWSENWFLIILDSNFGSRSTLLLPIELLSSNTEVECDQGAF